MLELRWISQKLICEQTKNYQLLEPQVPEMHLKKLLHLAYKVVVFTNFIIILESSMSSHRASFINTFLWISQRPCQYLYILWKMIGFFKEIHFKFGSTKLNLYSHNNRKLCSHTINYELSNSQKIVLLSTTYLTFFLITKECSFDVYCHCHLKKALLHN